MNNTSNSNPQKQILEYISEISGLSPSARIPVNGGFAVYAGVSKGKSFLDRRSLVNMTVTLTGKAYSQELLMDELFKFCRLIKNTDTYPEFDGFEIADIYVRDYPAMTGSENNGMFIWSCALSILYYTG